MNSVKATITINNVSEKDKISQYPYMIITLVDGEFWYYACGYNREQCVKAAKAFEDKVVIDNPYYSAN